MKEWNQTDTLVLLALLTGIALGTLSGYNIALERAHYTIDNTEVTQ